MIAKNMENLVENNSTIREMFEEGKRLASIYGKDNIYDFSLGNPSVKVPNEFNETIKEMVDSKDIDIIHGYMSNSGFEDVRKSIANSIYNRFNMDFDENNIIMTSGAAGGFNIVLKTILNPDDEVLVLVPYFMEYRNYIKNYNGKFVEVNCKENFEPNLEDLKSKITDKTKAIIINNPNNPSGVVYLEDTLKEIINIIEEAQNTIYIISDEPYREIVYDGNIVQYIPKLYKNTFVVYSYSKSLSIPGERIGYVAFSKEIEDYERTYSSLTIANRILGFVNANSLLQKVIGKCADLTADLEEYTKNRDLLFNGLTSLGFNAFKPQGAFYLFLKSPVLDEKEFVKKAKEYNILMVPGSSFAYPGYVRLAFCVDSKMIEKSLNEFKKLADFYNLL